jgi:DNA polymerase I-like protein with 3'-5' exonuclease and polymerase domains
MIRTVLIDARNFDGLVEPLCEKIAAAEMVGFDIETEDSQAHDGIKSYQGKRAGVFDHRRSTLCGFSIYIDGDDTAYYVNVGHADVENQIPWEQARRLLDAKSPSTPWIIHNAPFEISMLRETVGYEIDNYLCSLQFCVSAYNEDEYDIAKYQQAGLGHMTEAMESVPRLFHEFDPYNKTTEQMRAVYRIVGKSSKASFSYNNHVQSVRYGYGLKTAVKSWFNHNMTTYEQVTAGRHMGQLTGEEVSSYGADDAYWCVRIFNRVLQFIYQKYGDTPDAELLWNTFLTQENPMCRVYADMRSGGCRIDRSAVEKYREIEIAAAAQMLRELKTAVLKALPFPDEPNPRLLKFESWYSKGWSNYRDRITAWARSPDGDDRRVLSQVSGAVSSSLGFLKTGGPNFTHYMMMRTLFYDLCGMSVVVAKGKVQSDDETRNELLQDATDEQKPILTGINKLAGVEQRMKLFLTPYQQLLDPETDRVYPSFSSMLNSRRMAASAPNTMQLSKRGENTYVRGFYLADEDEHVIVSMDWSQIELVLIGDFSRDAEFARVYGQLPYEDLHTGSALSCLQVADPTFAGLTIEDFKKHAQYKTLRTVVGKGANFNYWYSGALSTVGEALGWTRDQMFEATDAYRSRFPEAERWRVETINAARLNGYVQLPDGHRRNRYEATYDWEAWWNGQFKLLDHNMFDPEDLDPGESLPRPFEQFGKELSKEISRRAGNQAVNSMIQGTCATLAKRSILRIIEAVRKYRLRVRFMMPIHDELVWSVHRREVVPFLHLARPIMTTHPDIVQTLPVDCTASVGRTFQPFHPDKAPVGQIELDEAPAINGWPAGKKLNDQQIEEAVECLFRQGH